MPYQQTFSVSASFKGASSTNVVYKLPFIPSATSTTTYGKVFHGALTARLVSVQGTLFVAEFAADKAKPFATAAVVATTNVATTVHGLAVRSKFAFSGQAIEFDDKNLIGCGRVLKGVLDDGERPAVHVAVSSSWDASAMDVAFISLTFTVEFEGGSDSMAFEQALTFA